jgi:hypothetical protein
MKARHGGVGLIALALLGAGWLIGQLPLSPRAEAQQGDKAKAGRYQVVSAGSTAVLFDQDTGKTWALMNGGMLDGPPRFGGFGGGLEPEYAWAPIAKFDDTESYRKWRKEQNERRKEGFGPPGGLPPGGPLPGFKDKPRFDPLPGTKDKAKLPFDKDKFDGKNKDARPSDSRDK